MWIPYSTDDDKTSLAVITAADALLLAGGMPRLMRELYLKLVKHYKKGVPKSAKVSTHYYTGDGCSITPIEAYAADKQGWLGEQDGRMSSGWGMTNYDRYFYWRMLDTVKLYEYLADASLPAPLDIPSD